MNFSPVPHPPYSPDAPRAHPPTHPCRSEICTWNRSSFVPASDVVLSVESRGRRQKRQCARLGKIICKENNEGRGQGAWGGGPACVRGIALTNLVVVPCCVSLLAVSAFGIHYGTPPLKRALWTAQKPENRRAPELPPQASTTWNSAFYQKK